MGLDSVELLMEVEDYFGISIPDEEAEKIYTVQAMVDTVARHLNITHDGTELRDLNYENLNKALLKLELIDTSLALTDNISKYITPDSKDTWEVFENELQLKVPKPNTFRQDSNKLINKIRSAIHGPLMYEWTSVTVDQFIAAICANNYEELINKEQIRSTYEIYIAVTAITVDKIGVEYYEVAPGKSFTTDLGID